MNQLVWGQAGFESYLVDEFVSRHISYCQITPHLFEVQKLPSHISIFWSQAVSEELGRFEFESIGDAQRQLKRLGKVWSYYPINSIRRGQLIADGLYIIKPKRWEPFQPLPKGPLNVFSLLDDKTILYGARVTPSIPIGSLKFRETPEPPSRAYIKLWEAFTYLGEHPKSSDKVIELGSSPGGWTWVLANQIGCQVLCIDRGEMDHKIISLKNVEWIKKDAFSHLKKLDPSSFQWLFSDMACDPKRLLSVVKNWVTENPNSKCVCTIKLTNQIPNVFELLNQFSSIPFSKVIHLNSNKHELTWLYSKKCKLDSR